MLEGIFGNKSAERILIHIFHYSESHGSEIATEFDMALNSIIQQLNRFELARVLISKEMGRSQVYSFNPTPPLLKPIKELIEIMHESISLSKRHKIFKTRRRPHRKGKLVQ